MLRKQTMLKVKYERQLLPMLQQMASLPLKDARHVNISSNVLRSLLSEINVFADEWIQNNAVTVTSRSKYSFVYAERMASHHYLTLLHQINSFKHAADCKLYGYMLTVNPRKLEYNEVSALNHLIVRMLKRDADVALIQKEVENTYYRTRNEVHIHYLVFSAQSLNRRKITRSAKRYGKRTTGSVTHAKIEAVDNDKHAASYVTKQYGLPLPLKNNQFERFAKLPKGKQMRLLADDINKGKGVERHRLYVNMNNPIAAKWYRRILAKNYCNQHGVLVKPHHNAKLTSENYRTTVFGVAFNKIYHNAHKRTSRHHYSEHEQLMQLYHGNVYYRHARHSQQLQLF